MDHEPSQQLESRCQAGVPGGARRHARARPSELRTRGIMDRTAHSAAGSKLGVGGIDDGIHLQGSDVDEPSAECHWRDAIRQAYDARVISKTTRSRPCASVVVPARTPPIFSMARCERRFSGPIMNTTRRTHLKAWSSISRFISLL
jgi:hypothetical protein